MTEAVRAILNIDGIDHEVSKEVAAAFEQLMGERCAMLEIICEALASGAISVPPEMQPEALKARTH